MKILLELKDVNEVAKLKDHLLKRAQGIGVTEVVLTQHFIVPQLKKTV